MADAPGETEVVVLTEQTTPERGIIKAGGNLVAVGEVDEEAFAKECQFCHARCIDSCSSGQAVNWIAKAAYVHVYENRLEWNDPHVPLRHGILPDRTACGCCNCFVVYNDRINVLMFDQAFSNEANEPTCCDKCIWPTECCCCGGRNVKIGLHRPGCCTCGGRGCQCGCPEFHMCRERVLRGVDISTNIGHDFILLPPLKNPQDFIQKYNTARKAKGLSVPVQLVMTRTA